MAEQNVRDDRESRRHSGSRKRRKTPYYAAVDLGTNNCRLLVAKPRRGGFTVVDSHSHLARLGEGLAASGRLSEPAIDRAMVALNEIAAKLKARKVGHVRCIATEACRRADNGADFIQRVREETGLTFKIISPEEEARLALIGCHNLIKSGTERILVIDIGGGSTELSFVDTTEAAEQGLPALLNKPPILAWRSLPFGVVTLTEAFAHLPEEEAYAAMRDTLRQHLRKWRVTPQISEAFLARPAHLIGTSGTVTCLTGVQLGLQKYRRDKVDGAWVNSSDMAHTIQRLKDAGPSGRAKFPTIGEDRAGLMLAGCAIVESIWELTPNAPMRIADRGLREGLLLSMIYGQKRRRSPRRRRRTRKTAGAGHE